MKNEIKEIIQLIGNCCYHGEISENECKRYCNYITNLQTIERQYSAVLSENAELQEENERLKELDENYPIEEQLEEALKENKRLKEIIKENTILVKDENGNYEECNINPLDYKSRIDKANKCIKENTRWFDSKYAEIYGELCDCAGAKDDRLEVLVNPSNLSKILGGDKDVKD